VERLAAQQEVKNATGMMEMFTHFYTDASTCWATLESRLLGHILLSPPILLSVGSEAEGYSEDWAVIEIDPFKVDASNFIGNAINLRTKILATDMHLNIRNPSTFIYPED
jgi:hypothetical protein